MPVVSVLRGEFLKAIGWKETSSDKEVDEFLFEFGLELDDVTSPHMEAVKNLGEKAAKKLKLSKEVTYKIEVPANRYDLLCLEGLSVSLNVFQEHKGFEKLPELKKVAWADADPKKRYTIEVDAATVKERPYAVGAVLRGLKLDALSYDSLINLQDKLHQNLGRERSLVAMGTHDCKAIVGQTIRYSGRAAKDIQFVPLSQTQSFDYASLVAYYRKEASHLAKYTFKTEGWEQLQPVFDDDHQEDSILSVPPVINGERTKISADTVDMFIECTGTDLTKLNINLNTLCAMFGQYCETPYTVEEVHVVYTGSDYPVTAEENQSESKSNHSSDNQNFARPLVTNYYPELRSYTFDVRIPYINAFLGVTLDAKAICGYLKRMGLESEPVGEGQVRVVAPCTRSDIMHAVDVAEDVAIGYGFTNLPEKLPSNQTVGVELPLANLSDRNREVVAQAGFTEVLTWTLSSKEENFTKLGRTEVKGEDGGAVHLENAKTEDFNIVRTSLTPGLLNTLYSNQSLPLPLQVFEVGDVCRLDSTSDVGAINRRHLAGAYMGLNSGFEAVHGLTDRVLSQNNAVFRYDERLTWKAPPPSKKKKNKNKKKGNDDGESKQLTVEDMKAAEKKMLLSRAKWVYWLEDSEDPAFMDKRRADVWMVPLYVWEQGDKGQDWTTHKDAIKIGVFGTVNPATILSFGLKVPVSVTELDIQHLL